MTESITTILLWIFILITIGLVIKLLLSSIFYYKKMDFDQVFIKEIKIPVGDIELRGQIFYPKFALDEELQPKTKLPLLFVNHGWGESIDMPIFKIWPTSFALTGPYICLAYELRGHGKSPGEKVFRPIMLDDVKQIFDFGLKLPGVDIERIGFFGRSFGATVALTTAYLDTRIKAIFSLVGLSDPKENFLRKPKSFQEKFSLWFLKKGGVDAMNLTDEELKRMSPKLTMYPNRPELNNRVFLFNSKDDPIISIDEFGKNREILNTPQDQAAVLNVGGHTTMHQELIILARAASFFHSKLCSPK